MQAWTIGHGSRPGDELLECLREAGIATLVDVRRFPGSRRHPQFNQAALRHALAETGIEYRHVLELGGRLGSQPGEERFACLSSFASYAARMGSEEWQHALASALALPVPCFMCAETRWERRHRRLIADFLVSRGYQVSHLVRPGETKAHRSGEEVEIRSGRLYLCGELVA